MLKKPRIIRHQRHVNAGVIPGQRSGAKPGQWVRHGDMDQAVVISPVSGSTISAVAWFCSARTDGRRRPTDCLRR